MKVSTHNHMGRGHSRIESLPIGSGPMIHIHRVRWIGTGNEFRSSILRHAFRSGAIYSWSCVLASLLQYPPALKSVIWEKTSLPQRPSEGNIPCGVFEHSVAVKVEDGRLSAKYKTVICALFPSDSAMRYSRRQSTTNVRFT